MRAETNDVAFRLLLALGESWDALQRAAIDPSTKGLYLTKEYLGGYTRFSAGPSTSPRLIVEWNESTRHLRVLRCHEWPGFEATISSTVAHVREQARVQGIIASVDDVFVRACQEPVQPARRTVLPGAMDGASAPLRKRA